MKRYVFLQVIVCLLLLSSSLVAKKKSNTPKKPEYDMGYVMLNDSTVINGFIKSANRKRGDIWFKASGAGEPKRYRPADLVMFKRDTFVFHSMFKVPLYSYFASLGRTTEEPEIFGRLVTDGKIRTYAVVSYGSDAITNTSIFLNYIFILDSAGKSQSATLPVDAPVTRKRERIVFADFEYFFQDYPKIRTYFRTYSGRKWQAGEFIKGLVQLVRDEG